MRTSNFSIFILLILLLFKMKKCMEDKGKGIEGESSIQSRGSRANRGRGGRGVRIRQNFTGQTQREQGIQTSVVQPTTQSSSQTFSGLLRQQMIQGHQANLIRQNPQLLPQPPRRGPFTTLLVQQEVQARRLRHSQETYHTPTSQTFGHGQGGSRVGRGGRGRSSRGRGNTIVESDINQIPQQGQDVSRSQQQYGTQQYSRQPSFNTWLSAQEQGEASEIHEVQAIGHGNIVQGPRAARAGRGGRGTGRGTRGRGTRGRGTRGRASADIHPPQNVIEISDDEE